MERGGKPAVGGTLHKGFVDLAVREHARFKIVGQSTDGHGLRHFDGRERLRRSGLGGPAYGVGGGREPGLRAGTEAAPQIAAFGTGAELGSAKMAKATKTMAGLRAHAIDRLTAEVDGLVVIGGGSPHILSISLPGYRSEVLMNFLEARGIYTSKSSACKKGGRSHVLEAIGLPANVIDGALRISFSRYTTREDIDALCDALRDAKQSLFPSLR